MATLPERQRKLVVDVRLEGHSMEEAAQRAGMTVTAVKVSVHRALKALTRLAVPDGRRADED